MKSKSTSRDEISKRILSARHDMQQARVKGLAVDSSFKLAYDSARIWCEVVIRAEGIRLPRGEGGHQKVITVSNKILGADFDELAKFLDVARKMRNKVMYEGEFERVTLSNLKALEEAVSNVENLVITWLQENHPDLLPLL